MDTYKIESNLELLSSKLIGEKIQVIFSDGIIATYGNRYLESKNIYLYINENKQILMGSKWFETNDFGDYIHKFHIQEKNKLDKLEKVSLYNFYDEDIISSVSVFTKTVTTNSNIIEFEYAIKIVRKDKKVILITAGDLAFRNLLIYQGVEDVNSIIKSEDLVERAIFKV